MKVIFLDIDGVLNVIPKEWDDYGAIFCNHFTKNLAYIIEKTGAKLVISSTWRHSGLDIMKEMWKLRELPGEVIDITGNDPDRIRGNEVELWVKENKPNNYVIIDDDSDFHVTQFGNFVRTFNNHTHKGNVEGYGLTKQCADEAIEILNRYE